MVAEHNVRWGKQTITLSGPMLRTQARSQKS
jgi:hypothetical protein